MDSKNIDKPIESDEEDLFGFKKVAELLAQSIAEPPNNFSITLGLEGQWGSGKSSILKLLDNALSARELKNEENQIGIVKVSFSPWLITNRPALISSFFAQLNEALELAIQRVPQQCWSQERQVLKILKSAKKKINQFSKVAATAATVVAAFDPTFLAAGTAAAGKAAEKYTAHNESSIEKLKSELTELLSKIAEIDQSFRVLVIIDDLDRLEPDETLEVVRLVKAVADFPATFYLLSYDRNVVASAIQQSLKINDGASYLEKIIQFSIKVPPLEPFVLRKWLQRELAKAYKNQIDFTSHRSKIVFDKWGGRLLKTPRDVRRLLLAIQLTWPILKDKVDLLDFVWLQMIKEKASSKDKDLYSWVCDYLQSLDAVAIGGRVNGKKESQEELEKILQAMGWLVYKHTEETAFDIDRHHLDQILLGVSHSYLGKRNETERLWIHSYTDDAINKAREDQRLSSPWHWRIYFAMELPMHALSDVEWQALIEASKESNVKLRDLIQALFENAKGTRPDIGDQLVERAVYGIRSSIIPNPSFWLMAIAELSETFEKFSRPDSIFGFRPIYEFNSGILAKEVILQAEGEEREKLLKFIFENFGTSCFISRVIRDQMHYENENEYERKKNLYLTTLEIKEIQKSLAKQYSGLTTSKLLELHNPWSVLYAWRAITGGFEAPKTLIQKSLSTNKGLVETLQALREVSSSTHGNIPHLRIDQLKDFTKPEALKIRLEKIAVSAGEFSEQATEILGVWDDRQ